MTANNLWAMEHLAAFRCRSEGCGQIIGASYSRDGMCYLHTSDPERLAKIEKRREKREARKRSGYSG